jgi:hypothetical protein
VWRICGGVRDITVRTGPALCNLTQQLQKVQSELTALLVALALVLAITVNVAETVIDTKSALTVTVLGGFWVDRVCSLYALVDWTVDAADANPCAASATD